MITITLLHPLQSVPVQNWTFGPQSVIRIGRSTDNEVILYSAVVSRHHVELRFDGSEWEIVNLGANGTYIDGKRIMQMGVDDGMVIRLASSGPKIQIRLSSGLTVVKDGSYEGKRSQVLAVNDLTKDTYIDGKESNADISQHSQTDLYS